MELNQPIYRHAKALLHKLAPEAKIILFGSRARGDAQEDADLDLLILLDKTQIAQSDFDQIAYPVIELGWRYGIHISPKIYTFEEWQQRSFTPFYKNVEKDGIVI